ncbi:MAG: branched-chain amino acid transport system permease protein [Thermoleophilaceae bacterium]|nr:branched-chain amino acid transport system permease protein [Thermoleophilaceae bacterium]
MTAIAQIRSTFGDFRKKRWSGIAIAAVLFLIAWVFPYFFGELDGWVDTAIFALANITFALGLNIVVGFAGLLDLGYVAFYAIGAYCIGWFGSDWFSELIHGGKSGIHVLVSGQPAELLGIHLNFILIVIAAMILTAIAGAIIGLPTLRLRGDYIAIVTLAFGEIASTIALNGDEIKVGKFTLTAGQQAISPIDQPNLPGLGEFNSAISLRPNYWLGLILVAIVLFVNFALRDSRLGRAWIALREDEVAAASMGVPLVRTKLLAYAAGASLGGMAGAFLGTYNQAINSNQFQFSFSILILAMIILGGLGSIWGTVVGAIILTLIDRRLIPDTFHNVPHDLFGLDFTSAQVSFGIFGFLLVIMMIARPEGLIPERRRKLELTEGLTSDESLYETRA